MGVAYKPGEHKKKLAHLCVLMPRNHHEALMRFRLGRLDLDVSLFALKPVRKPRAERTCRVCKGSSVEDEKQVLMECPAYEPVRRAVGFPEDLDMFEVMMTWDQVKLGGLLAQLHEVRKELLRE
jgi:hypothetical protein